MPHKQGYIDLLLQHHKTDANIYGIEIGCWQGEFPKILLGTFPNMRIISIDPYVQWEEIIQNTKDFKQRFSLLAVHSDTAAKILDGLFDFVFIDGDHSYEQCRKDILNYMRFLKPGGLISGHNYDTGPNSAHPGVHKSVNEIFGDKVKLQPDFTWYVQI